MEQRNSLVVILLAALLGSAAIVPRFSGPLYMASPAASSQSKSEGANASTTPLRATTAKGIVKEFLSGALGDNDYEVHTALLNVAYLKAIVEELFSGSLGDDGYESYVALIDASSLGRVELLPGWTIDSLIATVPDPIESGLPSQFDDYVDTIERAVSADHFIPDRFYNPWPYPHQLDAKAGGDTSVTQSDVGGDSPAEGQKLPYYERKPGLILFRDADHNKLLVVLLVGETPTAGVHKGAFESALQQAYELFKYNSNAAQAGEPPNQVKILGPTFSGSTTSMNNAIDEWRVSGGGHSCPIEIISGSASAVTGNEFSKGVSFQTTVVSIFSEVNALLRWLGRPHGKNVAVLSEENTFFGSWSKEDQKDEGPDDLLFLRFPLHIAELQAAAQRAAERAKGQSSTLPSLTLSNLPIDPQETRSRRDLIPLYSNFEVNSLELVLDSTLREIDEHEINYVIIAGTDPADTLFLVHWLRQNCPRVTPIALGADLRYLHTDFNSDTRGMIIASTYPLYLENQLWTFSAESSQGARNQKRLRRAIQFSTEGSEGTYNAARWLVSRPDQRRLLDYTDPFVSNSDDRGCKPLEAHPLWISMVGADQLWPISIQDGCMQAGYMLPISQTDAGSAADDELRLYPKAFVLVCFVITLGCFLSWSLIAANDSGNLASGFAPIRWLHSQSPVSIQQTFGDSVLREYSFARWLQLLLFSLVLLGLFATVAYFFFLPLFTPAWRLISLWKWAIAVVVSALALCAWWASIAPLEWFTNPQPKIFWRLGWLSVLVLVCLILLVVFGDSSKRLFLFLRTADLGSKVSPMVPMLLTYAAAIALIFGALRRLALLESRQILTPFLNFGTPSFGGFADLEQRVGAWLKPVGRSWRSCAIAVPIVIAYWLASPLYERDIYTPGFELLFFIASLAVYVGIGLAIVKMVSVWLSVRKLLRRIFTHPSRGGCDAYRQQLHFLKDPAVDLLSKVPAMSQLEVALDQVRQLVIRTEDLSTSTVPEVNARLSERRVWLRILLSSVECSIDETEQAQANDNWRGQIRKKRKAEVRMEPLSCTMAYIFEPLWRAIGQNKKLAQNDSKDPPSIDKIGEIYVASRVVDFLRQVMPQLESLAVTTTLAMLLMLFAVSSYPFPVHDGLLWFSWFVVLATVGSMMWMFFSLNRDRVASMIAGTTPGQINWNSTLVLQVATHALLPMLVLLGAAFPARLGTFVTWIGSLFGGHA